MVAFLIDQCQRGGAAVRRDAAACLLGLHGLRITEICRLRVRDLRRKDATIWVRTLKGGPAARTPLAPHAAKILQPYARGRRSSERLLATPTGKPLQDRNLRRRWSAWSLQLLGRRFRFHDLRWTTAQWIHQATNDLFAVQATLRHRKLENTAHYLRDPERIRNSLPTPDTTPKPPSVDAHSSSTSGDSPCARTSRRRSSTSTSQRRNKTSSTMPASTNSSKPATDSASNSTPPKTHANRHPNRRSR